MCGKVSVMSRPFSPGLVFKPSLKSVRESGHTYNVSYTYNICIMLSLCIMQTTALLMAYMW